MAKLSLSARLQLLALLLAGGLCWVLAESMSDRVIEAGDKAPNFTIVTDDGHKITRSDFGGKLLILNFWATWCPPCIEEIPSLDAMQKQLADKGVVVLAVSVDRNPQTYQQFLQKAKTSFKTARDPEADISSRYGTFKFPETYVINKDGRVVAKYIANQDWMKPELLQEIARAL